MPSDTGRLWNAVCARDDCETLRWVDLYAAADSEPGVPTRLVTENMGAAMRVLFVRDAGKLDVFVSDRYGALVDDRPYACVHDAIARVHEFLDAPEHSLPTRSGGEAPPVPERASFPELRGRAEGVR